MFTAGNSSLSLEILCKTSGAATVFSLAAWASSLTVWIPLGEIIVFKDCLVSACK